jgi:hypothetical protein
VKTVKSKWVTLVELMSDPEWGYVQNFDGSLVKKEEFCIWLRIQLNLQHKTLWFRLVHRTLNGYLKIKGDYFRMRLFVVYRTRPKEEVESTFGVQGEIPCLWIRMGDAADYHQVSSLHEAARLLHNSGVTRFEPRRGGLVCEEYRGNNYVSLYWGNAAADLFRELQDIEFQELYKLLGECRRHE